MRIAFLGSDAFAVPSLRALVDAGHEPVLVVTNPDRRRGRHSALLPTPVKELALELGAPLVQPEGRPGRALADELVGRGAELGVVVAYGQFLTRRVREAPTRGFSINLHGSLLPRWRGAAPVAAAIKAGDAVTGVSVQRVEQRMDAGPVLLAREEAIRPDDTREGLRARLSVLGAAALVEAVALVEEGGAAFREQDEALATYASILDKDDGRVALTAGAAELDRTVRAYAPWPAAFLELGGKVGRLQLLRVRPAAAPPEQASAPAGVVLALTSDEGLVVQTGEGALELLEVKPTGKRAMSGAAFARGRRLRPGEPLA